ncbi:MAG: BamA/TamA family outer membrane protein [Planctomyces sp.]|nr:BamA/TamA family outer membrane protein [Planctomyces sp.]
MPRTRLPFRPQCISLWRAIACGAALLTFGGAPAIAQTPLIGPPGILSYEDEDDEDFDDELEEPAPSFDAVFGGRLRRPPAGMPARGQGEQAPTNDLLSEPLAAVEIEGNATIPDYAIFRHIRCRANRPVSEHQIEEDVQALIHTRYFFRVTPVLRAGDEGTVLVFQVTERPILRSVEFKGNKKIKTSELSANTGLVEGHAYDVSTNRECVERLKSLYREKGFRHAEITLEKGGDPNDRDVVFAIQEGPKVRVWKISFEGNRDIRGGILKTKLATKTVLLWFFGGEFDPELVANDASALKRYYADLGYFDAEIDHECREAPESGKVEVVFKVREGKRYNVRNITIEGNEVLTQAQLLEGQKLKTGKPFSARFLQQDVNRMKEEYDELGRLFSKVEPTPRFLEQPGWVDVVYHIEEDQPRMIGVINIRIRGDHPHTQEGVVRNQVNRFLKPGHLASGKNLRMAQAVLQGHQIWDRTQPARIDVVPGNPLDYMPQMPIARGQSLDDDDLFREVAPFDLGSRSLQETFYRPALEALLSEDESDSEFVSPSATEVPATEAAATVRREMSALPTTRRLKADAAPQLAAVDVDAELASVARPASLPGSLPGPPQHRLPQARQVAPAPAAGRSFAPADEAPAYLAYNIDPDTIFGQPDEEIVIRGQSPQDVVRSQSIDGYGQPIPQNYLGAVSPQGDPFGDAFNRPGEPSFVDVNVDVSEGRTGRLMFGVGVNSDAGVVGQFTLQEDNFNILRPPRSWADIMNGQAWRGGGQSFRLEAMPGSEVSRYLVSWQDPYFLRTDYSLGVSGFYYNRFYNEWTEDRLGGRISLGRLLTRYWSLSTALRLENVDVRDFRTPAPPDLMAVKGDNFLSTALITLSHDTRDSAFLPTMGHLFEVSYEQGFGEFTYPRVETSASQIFTVWERPDGLGKHLLTLRGQLGWTGDDTPIFERFYAGGYSSFRGFAFRGVTPREMGFRVGGQWMSLGTVEYMAPITADDNIRVVGFSDFGTVESDVSMDNFRATVGFGFRLIIPAMGPAPIALDFAWPLVDQDEDNRRVFSFYVGFTR